MASAGAERAAKATRRGRVILRPDDILLNGFTGAAASCLLLLVIVTIYFLANGSLPAIQAQGMEFLTSQQWNSDRGQFGALAFIYGTFVSSLIALLVGGGIGVSLAAYLVELAPKWLLRPIGFLTDLLAAIPSIIYGIWGVFVLGPWLSSALYPELNRVFRWTGLFGDADFTIRGTGLLTAGIVLSVMIIPTVAAITREVLLVVPTTMRDGAMALGATRTEALKTVMLPYASGGILGALILGLGRALGETMAVVMVIGNQAIINGNLLASGATLASNIATEFSEAREGQRAALIALGLLLFVMTFILNVLARALVTRVRKKSGL